MDRFASAGMQLRDRYSTLHYATVCYRSTMLYYLCKAATAHDRFDRQFEIGLDLHPSRLQSTLVALKSIQRTARGCRARAHAAVHADRCGPHPPYRPGVAPIDAEGESQGPRSDQFWTGVRCRYRSIHRAAEAGSRSRPAPQSRASRIFDAQKQSQKRILRTREGSEELPLRDGSAPPSVARTMLYAAVLQGVERGLTRCFRVI